MVTSFFPTTVRTCHRYRRPSAIAAGRMVKGTHEDGRSYGRTQLASTEVVSKWNQRWTGRVTGRRTHSALEKRAVSIYRAARVRTNSEREARVTGVRGRNPRKKFGLQWWQEGTTAAESMLGVCRPGASRAAFLLGRTLDLSTQEGYQRNWDRFTTF